MPQSPRAYLLRCQPKLRYTSAIPQLTFPPNQDRMRTPENKPRQPKPDPDFKLQ